MPSQSQLLKATTHLNKLFLAILHSAHERPTTIAVAGVFAFRAAGADEVDSVAAVQPLAVVVAGDRKLDLLQFRRGLAGTIFEVKSKMLEANSSFCSLELLKLEMS